MNTSNLLHCFEKKAKQVETDKTAVEILMIIIIIIIIIHVIILIVQKVHYKQRTNGTEK